MNIQLLILKSIFVFSSFGFLAHSSAPSPALNLQEIKILKVVNCLPITNFDFQVQQKINKYLLETLKINGIKEKLDCSLESMSLEDFTLAGLCEERILEHYMLKICRHLPQLISPEEAQMRIKQICQNKKISKNELEQGLKKASITMKQLEDFFAHTIKVQKTLHYLLGEDSSRLTEDEIFRLILVSGGFVDLKVDYMFLSRPFNKKGLKELIQIRIALQKGKNPTKQRLESRFITEIQDPTTLALLLRLDTATASQIWHSGNTWNMIYLSNRKMIKPKTDVLHTYAQIAIYPRIKGNAQQLFSQLKHLSCVREVNNGAN